MGSQSDRESIRTWAAEHGRTPTTTDWTGADPTGRRPGYPRVQREFGTWDAALRAAGFEARPWRWKRGEVIDALRDWADHHGHPPTATDWQQATRQHPTPQTVARLFGSWPEALLAAGLSIRRRHRWQPEDILNAIRAWTAEHGRPPERTDWYRTDPLGRHPSTGTVHDHFGSWTDALGAAGVASQ